jgi:hypothetical protein
MSDGDIGVWVPTAAETQKDIQYGANGTELTGTLEGGSPVPPVPTDDSVSGKISGNLVGTFSGKMINYTGTAETITCEMQRSVTVIDDRYPFVEILGPSVEVLTRDNLSMDCNLHYRIEFTDIVKDKYLKASLADPASKQIRNLHADLMKLLFVDLTRGGNALMTEITGWGHYFAGDPASPELVLYLDIVVRAIIRYDNPYLIGA